MIFRTRLEVANGRIEAAPMVDVVFLLLIFFILSSSFVLQPGIEVELPPSQVKTMGAFQGLVITVTREDVLFFNEERTSMTGLRRYLNDTRAQPRRNQQLVIKADRQVPHGMVVEIMSMAIEAGITSINIATRPEMSVTELP